MIYFYIALLCFLNLKGDEFLYPVATYSALQDNTFVELNQNNRAAKEYVYLLYQKSISHVELWTWDPETLLVHKTLLSSYTPAALRILPDHSGFSFIDNGRIKIKSFAKRSPKSLDLYEPIYEIGVIEWIDAHHCYFSAKENEQSSIYQANIRGELKKIATSANADYLYPQKIEDELFYIARLQDSQGEYSYSIMSSRYPSITFDESNDFNNTEDLDLRVQRILKEQELSKDKKIERPVEAERTLIDFSGLLPDQALAFLHMESTNLGYVIVHPNSIDKQDKAISLTYYELRQVDKSWQSKKLFSFQVPLDLLIPERSSRLYESMLPLLPRHIGSEIYFVDCSQSTEKLNLNIYCYQLRDGIIRQLSKAQKWGQSFFAPIQTSLGIFYGGSMEIDSDVPPCMKINDSGMCFDLPKLAN